MFDYADRHRAILLGLVAAAIVNVAGGSLELWVGAARFPAMKQRHPFYYADRAGIVIILLSLGGLAAIIIIATRLH